MSTIYTLLVLVLLSVSIQSEATSASSGLASNTAAAPPIHLRFAEKPALPLNIKSVTPPSTDLGAVPPNITASSIRGAGTFNLRGLSSIPPIYYVAEPSATKAGCLSVVNYAGVFLHTYCGFPQNPFEYSNAAGSVTLGGLRLPIDGPYTIDLFISLKGQLAVRYPNGTVRLFGNMLPYYCLDNSNRFPCDIAYDEPVVYRTPFIRSTGEDRFDSLDTIPSGDLYTTPYVSLTNPSTLPYLNDSDLNVNRGGFERIAWSLTWSAWPPGGLFDDPQALQPVVRAPLRLAAGNSSSLVFFHIPINSMSFSIYANGKSYKRDAPVTSALYGWAASDSGESSQNNNNGGDTNIGRQ